MDLVDACYTLTPSQQHEPTDLERMESAKALIVEAVASMRAKDSEVALEKLTLTVENLVDVVDHMLSGNKEKTKSSAIGTVTGALEIASNYAARGAEAAVVVEGIEHEAGLVGSMILSGLDAASHEMRDGLPQNSDEIIRDGLAQMA